MIVFDCQSCGIQMQAAPENAGKRARCPSCGAIQRVPEIDDAYTQDQPDSYDKYDRDDSPPDLDDIPQQPNWQWPGSQEPEVATVGEAETSLPPESKNADGTAISSITWGAIMMIGALLWFFANLAGGRFSIYAPIIFIMGILKIITGLSKL